MDQLATTLEIINDLIEVNGQRIWNYQIVLKGSNSIPNLELFGVFEQIVDQGRRFQEVLELQFVELTDDLPKRGHPSGVILRAWEIVKTMFPISFMSTSAVFDSGERALLKAYRYAEKFCLATSPLQKIIADQQHELLAFYHQYKSLYREQQFV